MWRIAVLHHGSPASPALTALQSGLRRHRLLDPGVGVVDAAGAAGRLDRLPGLMQDLLEQRPHVVAAIGAVAALVAQGSSCNIPVLHATVLDPASIGLVGPNLAGVSTFDTGHARRQLRLLAELLPGVSAVACLTDDEAPRALNGLNPLFAQLRAAAADQRLQLLSYPIGAETDLDSVIGNFRRAGAQALVALQVPAVLARLDVIRDACERQRLPTVFPTRHGASGVLMVGPSLQDAMEPLAGAIAALARGSTVADLPRLVVRRHRTELHLGVARRIGLAIPPALLQKATRLHEDARPACPARRPAGSQA